MKLGQSDYLPQELVILTKFHEYRTKIVDFLLIVTFLASPDNCWTPSTYLGTLKVHTYILHTGADLLPDSVLKSPIPMSSKICLMINFSI